MGSSRSLARWLLLASLLLALIKPNILPLDLVLVCRRPCTHRYINISTNVPNQINSFRFRFRLHLRRRQRVLINIIFYIIWRLNAILRVRVPVSPTSLAVAFELAANHVFVRNDIHLFNQITVPLTILFVHSLTVCCHWSRCRQVFSLARALEVLFGLLLLLLLLGFVMQEVGRNLAAFLVLGVSTCLLPDFVFETSSDQFLPVHFLVTIAKSTTTTYLQLTRASEERTTGLKTVLIRIQRLRLHCLLCRKKIEHELMLRLQGLDSCEGRWLLHVSRVATSFLRKLRLRLWLLKCE